MPRGEVLVAIMNSKADMRLAREAGWYRIPVSSAKRFLSKCRWPPRWIAFYQTKVFGDERYAINYYAAVRRVQVVTRADLFPDLPRNHPKVNRKYYKLVLGELKALPQPIYSRRFRRVVFIPTTVEKFKIAAEINDLWDESPLEDRLWAIFKQARIQAERQYRVDVDDKIYFLDFAIFCTRRNVAVEADGDTYHIGGEPGEKDRKRNNDLESHGWHVLHFNTSEIHEHPVDYCTSKVMKAINRYGGLENEAGMPIQHNPKDPLGPQQLSLLDEL